MTAAPRVLFYVQHLVGIGHLKRASVIVRAMLRRGIDVTVVAGGASVPEVDFGDARLARLPAVHARDVESYTLVNDHGHRPGPIFWWRRRRKLLDLFDEVAPDAVVVDMFPFGRLQFRRELVPLMIAAKRRGCIRFSSMRDVVQPRQQAEGNEKMIALAERYLDRLLIHGDPSLLTLDRSLPAVRRISARLEYTGYVVDEMPAASPQRAVIVSAGGGAVGADLLRTALAARPFTRYRDEPWRLLCGLNCDARDVEALRAAAAPGVIVEQHRNDFPALLRSALVSVSQAGYNTTMELFAARCPSVLVPFAEARETEQRERCRAIAERGLARVIDDPTPRSLAAAIDEAQRPPDDVRIDISGAARTAEIVHDAIAQRGSR